MTLLVTWVVTSAMALGMDSFPLVQSVDLGVTSIGFRRHDPPGAPFVVLAVDRALASKLGCPPYAPEVLSVLEAALARSGVRQVLLPAGEGPWLSPDSRDRSGTIRYQVPRVLAWDNDARQWYEELPSTSERVVAIDAVSVPYGPDDYGVFRFTPPAGSGDHEPSLAWWLASAASPQARQPEEREIIRFSTHAGSTPIFPLSRILEGDVNPVDFQGRIPLLAVTHEICRPAVASRGGAGGMSEAELQVQAAQTLMKAPFRSLSWPVRLALFLSLGLVGIGVLLRIRFRMRGLVAALMAAVWLGLAVLVAAAGRVQVPLLAVAVQWLLLVIVLDFAHVWIIGRELRQNNARLIEEISRLGLPGGGSAGDQVDALERWVRFVRCFLPVRGAYLLLKPERSHGLSVAFAVDAPMQAVVERRKDIRRSPWREVAARCQGGEIAGFLEPGGDRAYGIPVFQQDACRAVVVLTLPADAMPIPERGRAMLARLVGMLLPALPRRTETRRRQWFGGLLRALVGRDALREEIVRNKAASRRVLEDLEKLQLLLDRMDIGILLCDLLGQVTTCNAFARDTLTKLGIALPTGLIAILESAAGCRDGAALAMMEAAILGEPLEGLACGSIQMRLCRIDLPAGSGALLVTMQPEGPEARKVGDRGVLTGLGAGEFGVFPTGHRRADQTSPDGA